MSIALTKPVSRGAQYVGFDWKSLKPGDIVVDVGGSAGTVTHAILKENPHLRYIVQDQESVIYSAAKPVRSSFIASLH